MLLAVAKKKKKNSSLKQPIKNLLQNVVWRIEWAIMEHLPCMYEVLGLIPVTCGCEVPSQISKGKEQDRCEE